MFKHIDVIGCRQMMNDTQPVVIDIRDTHSFNLGHIPNARNIDSSNIQDFIVSADKQIPVVVCCYHGNSSQPAAAYLCEQEFDSVYSLDGGFEDWKTHNEFSTN